MPTMDAREYSEIARYINQLNYRNLSRNLSNVQTEFSRKVVGYFYSQNNKESIDRLSFEQTVNIY